MESERCPLSVVPIYFFDAPALPRSGGLLIGFAVKLSRTGCRKCAPRTGRGS
jgi:hypothetical protein